MFQQDFDGNLIFTGSDDTDQPQQLDMFAQGELAQFGVSARPFMPLTGSPVLILNLQPGPDDGQPDDLTAPMFAPQRISARRFVFGAATPRLVLKDRQVIAVTIHADGQACVSTTGGQHWIDADSPLLEIAE
jgi:hypothetical protein